MNMNSRLRRHWLVLMIPAVMALCWTVWGHARPAATETEGHAVTTVESAGLIAGNAIGSVVSEVAGNSSDGGVDEVAGTADGAPACAPLLNHSLRPLMGPDSTPLCNDHAGKVLLLVNTASKCGFTPQFKSLEALHQRYGKQGFEVLGFPSDDFRQELASEEAVAEFCELNYGVSFPMFQKIHVRSADAHPLYRDLAAATGSYPGWNFNKYLIDRNGEVVEHYGSSVLPMGEQMIRAIEALL